ncbi:MAG: hypothetical protein RLZZ574_2986, partial [Cyanobacteriota bacterium]
IIFGENASLDVGGSFIATTADSIQFEGGTEFAANDSTTEPIISIERPIGLGFGSNPGAIQVNGNGSQIASDTRFSPIEIGNLETGISVNPGKTLALIGGGIALPSGIITVKGGKIEIGSVNSGLVSFQSAENGLAFSYENVTNYQDITLTEQALLDISGDGTGAISLTGDNVLLSNGSFLLNQNRGDVDSGNININALESLNLSGTSPDGKVSSSIRSESLSAGQASNINISTKQLYVLDDSQIRTGTYSEASGSNVTVDASNLIRLAGGSISNSTFSEGNAGSLQISTSQFQALDAGGLTSATVGSGSGGNITVNADSIELVGGSSFNRSGVSASSFNTGNAGNLNINTKQLQINDGATVSSSSFANGNAGSVNIDAIESINVSGINSDFKASSNPESSITSAVRAASSQGQRGLNLPSVPNGNSGNVTLNTPFLRVSQQANITVDNQGLGNGGTLLIDADSIDLDKAGSITAAAISGRGGNINLKTEQLQLDDNSSITATAENNGDGGNVTINTTSLLAKKNSEITANAFAGTGGNIQINAQGFFLFPDSTIEASSELGIDGTVRINTLDTNLQKDLEPSELNLITDEDALANSCLAFRNKQQGTFVINNGSSLSTIGESEFYDSGSITGIENTFSNWEAEQLPIIEPQSLNSSIPAQQAVKTKDGRVFLVSAPQSVKSLICN